MKHLTAVLLWLTASTATLAQPDAQRLINEQVWRPFIQAYENSDAEAFLDVHAGDVIRILRDSKEILPRAIYAENLRQNMAGNARGDMQRDIELRFTERFADGDLAFEAGYYRVITSFGADEQYTYYGRFHVVLRRENGRWKILLDSDTNDGGRIGAADFQQAQPME